MPTRSLLGVLGSALLILGVFLPIMSIPIVGDLDYFHNGRTDAAMIIVLALLSMILGLAKRFKALWVTGLASLGVLAFNFIHLRTMISQARSAAGSELPGNYLATLSAATIERIQMAWGWAVLVIGGIVVIVAAAMKDKAQSSA